MMGEDVFNSVTDEKVSVTSDKSMHRDEMDRFVEGK